MKLFVIILTWLIAVPANTDLEEIRKLYPTAKDSKANVEQLYQLTERNLVNFEGEDQEEDDDDEDDKKNKKDTPNKKGKKGVKNKKNAVLMAYYGAALTLKASYADKKEGKISFFRKGVKMIDKAIAMKPKNVELRMIRLSVQTNAPKITRYQKDIATDKDFIEKNLNKIKSTKLKTYIAGFMKRYEEPVKGG